MGGVEFEQRSFKNMFHEVTHNAHCPHRGGRPASGRQGHRCPQVPLTPSLMPSGAPALVQGLGTLGPFFWGPSLGSLAGRVRGLHIPVSTSLPFATLPITHRPQGKEPTAVTPQDAFRNPFPLWLPMEEATSSDGICLGKNLYPAYAWVPAGRREKCACQ